MNIDSNNPGTFIFDANLDSHVILCANCPGRFYYNIEQTSRAISGSVSDVTIDDIVVTRTSNGDIKYDLRVLITELIDTNFPTITSSNNAIATPDQFGLFEHLTDGTITITIENNDLIRSFNWTFTTVSLGSSDVFKNNVPGTLRNHMWDQFQTITGDKNLFSVMDGTTFTLNNNCWICNVPGLLDAYTCVMCWNSYHGRYEGLCAIAEDTVLGCTHYTPQIPNGTVLTYRKTNGTYGTTTVLNQRLAAYDLYLFKVAPMSGIQYAKILPATWNTKIRNSGKWLPIIFDDAEGKVLIGKTSTNGFNGYGFYFQPPTEPQLTPYFEYPIGGDSGGAVAMWDGSNYVLIGVLTTSGSGSLTAFSLTEIQTAMTAMGCTGTLTYPDWSSYTTF